MVDALTVLLFIAALAGFLLGVLALAGQRELEALYWLVVGALLLRGSVRLALPRAP